MVDRSGIGPASSAYKALALPLSYQSILEPVEGIAPTQ